MKRTLLLLASLLLLVATSLQAQHFSIFETKAPKRTLDEQLQQQNLLHATLPKHGKGFSFAIKDLSVSLDGTVGSYKDLPNHYISVAIRLPKNSGTIKGVSFIETGSRVKGRAYVAEYIKDVDKVIKGNTYHVPQVKVIASKEIDLNHRALTEVAFDKPVVLDGNKEYFVGYETFNGNTKSTAYALLFDMLVGLGRDEQQNISYLAYRPEKDGHLIEANNNIELMYVGESFGAPYIYVDIDAPNGELDNIAKVVSIIPKRMDKKVYKPDEILECKFACYNFGLQPLNNVELSIKDNGESVKVDKLASLPIGVLTNQLGTFTSKAYGTHLIEAYVKQADGKENYFKDAALYGAYMRIDYSQAPKQKDVLLERFTTEMCPNCPPFDKDQDNLVKWFNESGYRVNIIAHHVGFYTDHLTLPEDEEHVRKKILFISAAPMLSVNRHFYENAFALFSTLNDLHTYANDAIGMGSPVHIESITCTKSDKAQNSYAYEVKGKLYPGFNPNNLYITVLAVEDDLESIKQQGADKGYIHNNVARKYYTSVYGNQIKDLSGDSFTYKIDNIAFSDNWDSDKTRLVVFLHGNARSDIPYEKAVYSSISIEQKASQAVQPVLPEDLTPIAYARDGFICIKGMVESYSVYSITGEFMGLNPMNRFSPGVYLVKAIYGEQQFLSKVIVD